MSSVDILTFLLQQQQQQLPGHGDGSAGGAATQHTANQQQQQPSGDVAAKGFASAAGGGRALPSVEEFVPVMPKSLLNLIRGDASGPAANTPGAMNGSGGGAEDSHANAGSINGGGGANAGALVLLEAPKIAPDVVRRARESRRAHISGFPLGTTKEELEVFFRRLLVEVRLAKTKREIRELAEESGLLKAEGEEAVRDIPANASLEYLDHIKDLSINMAKTKAFSFIEVDLADIVTEMVEQCAADPQRYMFTPTAGGRSYPLVIRRPRDYEPLLGMDESKVMMTGFPPSLPESSIRPVFESFGELLKFELKEGLAYAEFADPRDALDFRADVHGILLGSSMVITLPLYDWIKVLCVQSGIDVSIDDSDPVSGKYVMRQVQDRTVPVLSSGPAAVGGANSAAANAAGEGGGGGSGGMGEGGAMSNALVLAQQNPEAASLMLMKELLEMSVLLPDVLLRFAALYPHTRPIYGNSQLTIYPTPVLVLLNLFDEEELTLDSTYSTLLADIEEEVEQYGRVKQLVVPRREVRPRMPEPPKKDAEDYGEYPDYSTAFVAYEAAKQCFAATLHRYLYRQAHPVWGGIGRVFVQYETVDEAAYAQQEIAGKLFGERTVVTSFAFEDLLRDGAETPEPAAKEEGEEVRDTAAETAAQADADNDGSGKDLAEDAVAKANVGEDEEEEGNGTAAVTGGIDDVDAVDSAVGID